MMSLTISTVWQLHCAEVQMCVYGGLGGDSIPAIAKKTSLAIESVIEMVAYV